MAALQDTRVRWHAYTRIHPYKPTILHPFSKKIQLYRSLEMKSFVLK